MARPQALDALRQIATDMTALPEKYGHNAYAFDTACDELRSGCLEIGLHQLQKSQSNRRCGLERAHALDERFERLGPSRIARTMRKQN
jgi:hypothetical protein